MLREQVQNSLGLGRWILASDTVNVRSLCTNWAFVGVSVHGKAVDAAADRCTDKRDLGGGGESKIRAAHRFPVNGDGWEGEGSKEMKALQIALLSLDL